MDGGNREVGIYAIISEGRDLLYIGSSDHIVRRWIAHRSQLRRGIHHGKWLQRIWAKDGEDAFSFVIIERVSVAADLICREQWWINRLRPALNCDVPAGNPMMGRKHSQSAREKMSAAHTGKIRGPLPIVGGGQASNEPCSPATTAVASRPAHERCAEAQVVRMCHPEVL
ncbi:GIY-YIG nuclease family protein [Mesorhizobium sp. M1204]